ncbi:MAG: TRAP transporter large permease [Cardiobacteriaceae bacterium]|nr:TRAP transporter large permease [Cardiobacteriaceae bacterium]
MSLFLLTVVFLVGLAIGIPVAITLGVASLAYILSAGIPLVVVPQKIFAGMDIYVLLCIPGFVLAGNLMNGGGITPRIINFAQAGVGWMRGGLGMTNVASSMLFGGISGTAVADAASIGGMMIPGMKRAGYPADFSAAVTSASSTMGPIIPPSVPMIIVGALSGISVGKMFIAGVIPGLLLGVAMLIITYIISVRRSFPRHPWQGWMHLWQTFIGAFWALAMTALIVGGMVSGFATPTETSIVAAVYAIVVGCFVYRELPLKKVPSLIIDSAVSSAAILLLVGTANVFGWILVSEHIPQMIADAVLSLTTNKYVVILLLNLVLIFVGMFMETIAALIILFIPLLTVAQGVGIDPIHFAVFAVLNLMIGLSTPPVGVCLFICANIAREPLTRVVRALIPYIITNLIVLLLVSYIPALSTWLPSLMNN